jgi:hypothetical protein
MEEANLTVVLSEILWLGWCRRAKKSMRASRSGRMLLLHGILVTHEDVEELSDK